MLFVDGENLAIRGADYAKARGIKLTRGDYYEPDTFLWFPGADPLMFTSGTQELELRLRAIRASYYTSVVGDMRKLERVREQLWDLNFHPEVFKKPKGTQAKGVDITITRDMLMHGYQDNYDVAVLIAGDGDYVPLIEELKRRGKVVSVAFFSEKKYGLNNELKLAADSFGSLGPHFEETWKAAS